MAPHVAVTALALVGLFNIVGTYTTGWLGSRVPKRYILSFIYFARAVVIALFIGLPLSTVFNETLLPRAHAFQQSAGQAIREAMGHRGYLLLTLGFFVCGFHVVFIGVHLPAYLADKGMAPHVAVTALALVGLFNIVGTYTAGLLGGRMPKRWILSFIYFARAVVIAVFVWLPVTPWSVYVFAMALGLLWLSTVPVTNGIVAGIFGVRYLGMLSGVTFFSHQIGSFLGAWLGGRLYDTTGSYDVVWWLAIALGVVAGLINLPIDEKEIRRPAPA
jgi:predicted MFS family arabinose efflux permease